MKYFISYLAKFKKGQSFGIAIPDGVIAFECKGLITHKEIDKQISKCVFVDEASGFTEKQLSSLIRHSSKEPQDDT